MPWLDLEEDLAEEFSDVRYEGAGGVGLDLETGDSGRAKGAFWRWRKTVKTARAEGPRLPYTPRHSPRACIVCGTRTKRARATTRFEYQGIEGDVCSAHCRTALIPITCVQCHREFQRPREQKRGDVKLCSPACAKAQRNAAALARYKPIARYATKACDCCKKTFEYQLRGGIPRRYCTDACYRIGNAQQTKARKRAAALDY